MGKKLKEAYTVGLFLLYLAVQLTELRISGNKRKNSTLGIKWKTSSYLTFLRSSLPSPLPPSNLSIKFSYFACTAYARLFYYSMPCKRCRRGSNFFFSEMPVNRTREGWRREEVVKNKNFFRARNFEKKSNNNNNLHLHDFISSECEKKRGESVFNTTK